MRVGIRASLGICVMSGFLVVTWGLSGVAGEPLPSLSTVYRAIIERDVRSMHQLWKAFASRDLDSARTRAKRTLANVQGECTSSDGSVKHDGCWELLANVRADADALAESSDRSARTAASLYYHLLVSEQIDPESARLRSQCRGEDPQKECDQRLAELNRKTRAAIYLREYAHLTSLGQMPRAEQVRENLDSVLVEMQAREKGELPATVGRSSDPR